MPCSSREEHAFHLLIHSRNRDTTQRALTEPEQSLNRALTEAEQRLKRLTCSLREEYAFALPVRVCADEGAEAALDRALTAP